MSELLGCIRGNFIDSLPSKSGQKVRDRCERIKTDRWDYNNTKILYEAVLKCLKEDKYLNESLKKKVNDILTSCEAGKYTNLYTNHREFKLLELDNFVNEELTYDEQNELKCSVEKALIHWNDEMTKELNKLGVTNTNGDCKILSLSVEDQVLIDFKGTLNKSQENYLENLQTYYSLLEQIVELRLKTLQDGTELKVQENNLHAKMYSLQLEIVEEKARIDVFMETRSSIDAYKELIKDISEQQNLCHREIDELEELNEKYKQISCKQYDEILSLYLQYKSATERKKLLYQKIKGM